MGLPTRVLICPPYCFVDRAEFFMLSIPSSPFLTSFLAHFRTRILEKYSGSLLLSSFVVFSIISVAEYGATLSPRLCMPHLRNCSRLYSVLGAYRSAAMMMSLLGPYPIWEWGPPSSPSTLLDENRRGAGSGGTRPPGQTVWDVRWEARREVWEGLRYGLLGEDHVCTHRNKYVG